MFSNLTHRELFRLHGTLPPERVESLLDDIDAGAAVDVAGALIHISEARGQFPAEDFASEIVSQLQALRANLRGANRDKLGQIIESLEDLLQCQFNATDYGLDELHQAELCLKKSVNDA